MPTYNYKCSSCEHVVEVYHGINEERPSCPECEEKTLEVFYESAPSFHTVGMGWGGKNHPV